MTIESSNIIPVWSKDDRPYATKVEKWMAPDGSIHETEAEAVFAHARTFLLSHLGDTEWVKVRELLNLATARELYNILGEYLRLWEKNQ